VSFVPDQGEAEISEGRARRDPRDRGAGKRGSISATTGDRRSLGAWQSRMEAPR